MDSHLIWSMCYTSHEPVSFQALGTYIAERPLGKIVSLPTRPHDISLQDETLSVINTLWTAIRGSDSEGDTFLRFAEREQEQDAEA